jgi:hypothetical protein
VVRSVKVPRRSGTEPWGRPVTDRDIDATLESVALGGSPSHVPAAAGLLAALPLAALVLARRSRA